MNFYSQIAPTANTRQLHVKKLLKKYLEIHLESLLSKRLTCVNLAPTLHANMT